jgi:hypothetical protein
MARGTTPRSHRSCVDASKAGLSGESQMHSLYIGVLTRLVPGSPASANRRRISADASPRTTSTSAQASATRQNESHPNRYTEEDQGQVEPHAVRKRQR